MNTFVITRDDSYAMYHHGVKGQKWGERRYQNEDGSLTSEGYDHYGVQQGYEARQMYKRGTITRDQKREAVRAKGALGKVDNVLNLGFGRRLREFESRHKKGVIAASAGLAAIGAMIPVAVAATGAASLGAAAVASILAGGVGSVASAGVAGGITSAVRTHVVNPLMLKYGYNGTLGDAKKDIEGRRNT